MSEAVGDQLDDGLNLKQAASRLGVHYMTAYRYVRQGRLRAHRHGTDWRVPPESIVEFLGARDLDPAGADSPLWANRLVPALLDGDEPAAWAIIQAALAAGRDPVYCYLDMIAGAIALVDGQRELGDLTAADLPIATAVAHRLVARLGARFRKPGRSRGSVVFGSPVGERHHLPLAIVADLLRLDGFDVLELGADTEPAAFAAAARRARRLVAVALSISHAGRLDAARDVIAAVRAVDPTIPVVVGGRAVLNPEVAGVLDADAWAPDGRSAVDVISGLAPRATRRSTSQPASTAP